MANVSAHQLKPLELSAMDVGCSIDNKNGDGKPTTSTISTLSKRFCRCYYNSYSYKQRLEGT